MLLQIVVSPQIWGATDSISLYECLSDFVAENSWESNGKNAFYAQGDRGDRGDGTIYFYSEQPEKYQEIRVMSFLNEYQIAEVHDVSVKIYNTTYGDGIERYVSLIGEPDSFLWVLNEPAIFSEEFLSHCLAGSTDVRNTILNLGLD